MRLDKIDIRETSATHRLKAGLRTFVIGGLLRGLERIEF